MPPKQSTIPNVSTTRRPRSNTQSLPPTPGPPPSVPPVSILKTRTPITAPSTPDNLMDDDDDDQREDDEEIRRLELEQAEFDILCQENTNANSTMITTSSPVSLESDDTTTEEEEEPPEQQQSTQPQQQQAPVYGSLASTKPISKSDQVCTRTKTGFFLFKKTNYPFRLYLLRIMKNFASN